MNDTNKQWWMDKKWNGMKAVAPRVKRPLNAQLGAEPRLCTPFTWVPWCIPSENQNGPSCAGHGIANFKEIMLRRYVGMGSFRMWEQIDGDAIWAYARKMYYGSDMDGGLYIPEAFGAALKMGVFAPGSVLKTVPRNDALFTDQFTKTPFIDGHDVSAWMNHGLSDVNGQVFEGGYPDGTGGHCTVRATQMNQNGQNYVQYQNSWGVNFGWHGLYIMSEGFDSFIGLEDNLYYVEEPEGWEQWDGWKKFIIGG